MMQPRKPGFHTKLNMDLHHQIITAVPEYITIKLVAASLRIPRKTLRDWLKRGNEEAYRGEDTPFTQLTADFEAARAEAVKEMLSRVRNHSEEWQASWSLLKALEREDFGSDGADLLELKSQLEELKALMKFNPKQIKEDDE